jgi:hypothetical protein
MEMWLMFIGVLLPVAGLLRVAERRLQEPRPQPADATVPRPPR